jgi:hypothetical protein
MVPFWEADSRQDGYRISGIVYNSGIHYSFHNNPPLDSVIMFRDLEM